MNPFATNIAETNTIDWTEKEKHFPTITREFAAWRNNPSARNILSGAFQTLCEAIEDKYGRLAPNVCENDAYEKNRLFYVQEVINEKHIDEKMGSTFMNIIDLNSIKQQLRSMKYYILIFFKLNLFD